MAGLMIQSFTLPGTNAVVWRSLNEALTVHLNARTSDTLSNASQFYATFWCKLRLGKLKPDGTKRISKDPIQVTNFTGKKLWDAAAVSPCECDAERRYILCGMRTQDLCGPITSLVEQPSSTTDVTQRHLCFCDRVMAPVLGIGAVTCKAGCPTSSDMPSKGKGKAKAGRDFCPSLSSDDGLEALASDSEASTITLSHCYHG